MMKPNPTLATRSNELIERRLPRLWLFIVLALAASLSILAFVKLPAPTGVDFYYHLEYAQQYAQQPVTLTHVWNVFWNSPKNAANNGPYPPLFHLVLAAVLAAGGNGGALLFGRLIELFAYAVPIGLAAWLAYRHKGAWAAALTAVLLFSSIALFDRGAQATPQALDMVAFPLVALALLHQPKAHINPKSKPNPTMSRAQKTLVVIPLAAAVWAHGAYALLFAGGLVLFFVHKMFDEKFANTPSTRERFCLVQQALFWSLPVILVILAFLPAQLAYAGKVHNAQDALIRANPTFGLWYAGAALSAIALPALLYFVNEQLVKKQKTKRVKLNSDFEWLAACWFVALLPLAWAFPDRFASYAAFPIALLGGWFLSNTLKGKTLALTAAFLVILSTAIAWNYLGWWVMLGLTP